LGYNLPPLTGLRKDRRHEKDFVSELLTQDTSAVLNTPKVGLANGEKRMVRRAGIEPARPVRDKGF